MALTTTVTLGWVPSEGATLSVENLTALGLPQVSLTGSVEGADIANGAITFLNLSPNLILDGTEITTLQATDMVLVGDDSASANAVITVANFIAGSLGVATSATSIDSYALDVLFFRRSADGELRAITAQLLAEALINQATELTSTSNIDAVLVTDASADSPKVRKVALENLLPNVVVPNTYANPTSLTVNAKGQVTAVGTSGVHGTQTSEVVEATQYALPTGSAYANATAIPHGLGAAPTSWTVRLICTDAGGDAGWVQNDVIEHTGVLFDSDAGGGDAIAHYIIVPDATNLRIMQPEIDGSSTNGFITNKSTGQTVTFTPTKWKAMISARR